MLRSRLERAGDELGLDRDCGGARRHDQQGARKAPGRLAARRVSGEHVAVGHQGVDEVGGVEQQQHDRDAEAQPLVGQREVAAGCRDPLGEIEDRGQQNGNHDQEQQGRQQTGAGLAEGLPGSPEAADQRRDAEKEECGADDRAGNLRLHDTRLGMGEDEKREHELGGVAKADIEQTADGAAGALGELLGGAADPVGEHRDRDGAGKEDPAGRGIDEVAQSEGQRNEQQKRVGHDVE